MPSLAGTRLPALLVEFARRYPAISVRVRESPLPELLEAVRRREVDFGIGPEIPRPTELEFRSIFQEDYVALLPRSHPAAQKKGISLRELARMPLMTISDSHMEVQLREAMREEQLPVEMNYDFTSVSTAAAMVEAGLGVAVIPAVAVPARIRLKAVRIIRPVMTRTISVVTIRGHTLSPSASRFVELAHLRIPPARPLKHRA